MAAVKCFVFIFVISLFNYIQSNSIICEEGFCRNFLHETGCTATSNFCNINNATHSGLILPSPTVCNCCDYCLPFYNEGEHCSIGGPGTGSTIGRCADGLTCAVDPTDGETRCFRLTSECHKLQDDYDQRESKGQIGALEQRPMCDGKGKFAATACVPGHTCFCQSEDGDRIFGEALFLGSTTLRHMQCGCSRLHEKIRKTISTGLSYPVTGPRCTTDGNFNPVQCIDRSCYCVDPVTGIIEEDVKSINLDDDSITDLTCYNPNLDNFPQYNEGKPPYNYTTPCFEDLKEKIVLVQQSEEDGYNIDFSGGLPECYPDGTFGRIGYTTNGSKICVNERGRRIGDYEAQPRTEQFSTMDCKCAYTSYVMGASTEKPVCCRNGNFRPIQCRRGMCRCVDSDGRQTETETANVNNLECKRENWKTC